MVDSAIAQLRFGLQVLGVALVLASFCPRVGIPQQAAIPAAAAEELSVPARQAAYTVFRAVFERRRFLNAASGNGGDNLDSAAIVESAQTNPPGTWSPSVGISSTKGTYKFPLTLTVQPVVPAEAQGQLRWRFAQSELAATYSPTQVKPMTSSTRLATAPTKMGTLSYKFPLKGRDETQEMAEAFQDMTVTADQVFKHEMNLLTAPQAMDAAESRAAFASAQAEAYLDKKNDASNLKPILKIDFKLSYDWDHSVPTPNTTLPADYLTASLLASKQDVALGKGNAVFGFSSTLSNAWFQSLSNQAAYKRDEIGVGGEIGRKGAFYFGLQGTYDHYSGAGFNGLRGVTDTKLRDDVVLAEIVRFAVPGGHKLELAVKEMHANTSDMNLLVIATTTFKFPTQRKGPSGS